MKSLSPLALVAAPAVLALLALGAGWAAGTGAVVALLAVTVALLWAALFSLVQTTRSQERALRESLSEESRAREQALEAERRDSRTLAAVLDGMAEGIWITDDTGIVVRHNDALKEMLYAGQELIGRRPVFLVRNGALHEAVLRACQSGESSRLEVAIEGVRPRLLAVRVAPLGHELQGSAAVFRDITELRRLERVRQDFVANVSHELRTPITAIRGYAETLQSGGMNDVTNAPKMVEIIHRQSERLSELVSDLLDLSRLDAGELSLKPSPVHLAESSRRAAEAVAPKALSKRLHVELQVGVELCAFADEKAVEQVLINLLDNAIKYTPEGGAIQVRGFLEDRTCVLEVRDNGLGIEAKHLPRLFERFYRADRGRSRDMGGTGLGLSIVKHLVAAMNGDVRVQSQPGEGSTFTVTLPAT